MSRCTGECEDKCGIHGDRRVHVIVGCEVWELPHQGAREVPRRAKPAERLGPIPL